MGKQLSIVRDFMVGIAERCAEEFIKRTGIRDIDYIAKIGAKVFTEDRDMVGQALVDALEMPTDVEAELVLRDLVNRLVEDMVALHYTGSIMKRNSYR